ncbi:tyrosinase [Stachybotrys elegans]|uniref:tyrosinase n=1 Tax=Stachybotrys elegans TaxID=80388 RepID=A0A8K0SPJ6_9HYPO|nr:tyrosinase [Stachybotrys elegans]
MLRLPLLFWALCALSTLVTAQTNYPITGIKVAKGSEVPLRRSINAFSVAGGPQWDLYLRALADLYSQDAKSQLSFFQVAGIHGRPYIEWNGAGKRTSDGWLGYCPHGENLFLTWHRPYVMLFEQRLVDTAVRLANQYPSKYRAQYVKAAQTLRAPFWDWGTGSFVPPATVPAKMKVKVPNGNELKTIEIDNPLRTYRFPKSALNGEFGGFSKTSQINRCPSPQSYPNSANQAIAKRPYKQWIYDLFTRAQNFNQFASTSSSGASLEMIHNAIHWDGACGGQFLDADYSAFDPLFMLHHTNVDRLWAYWQFIKPQQSSFTGSYSGGSRFSTPSRTSIGPQSPLKPFFAAPGKFHTSESVKSIKNFGYTYEGLEYWKKSDQQMQKDAIALINRLYAPKSSGKRKRSDEPDTRYFAQLKVDVEQLDRPCSIDIYTNTTSVGSFIVLKQPATGFFNGEFTLDKVANPVEAKVGEADQVVDDILSSLRVEITKHDGTVIPLDSVTSLKMKIENSKVIPPSTVTELPEFVDTELHVVLNEDIVGVDVGVSIGA